MKVAASQRFEPYRRSPFWDFARAIEWIAFRSDEMLDRLDLVRSQAWEDDPDRATVEARLRAQAVLHHALLDGGIVAIGVSQAQEQTIISATEWLSRQPIALRGKLNEPFDTFLVDSSRVRFLFPAKTARGRKEAFNWKEIVGMYQEERKRGLSRTKAIEVLMSRCAAELGVSPSKTAIRAHTQGCDK